MEDKLNEILLHICTTLTINEVQYLIIGGTAVALHGFFRMSIGPTGVPTGKYDIDIWYNPTYPNYFKLLDALENLGEDVSEFKNEQTPNPTRSFFKLDFELFTLDCLPSMGDSQKFIDSFNRCDYLKLNGVEVPYISFNDLIQEKERQGRPTDIEDVRQLKKLRENEDRNNNNLH